MDGRCPVSTYDKRKIDTHAYKSKSLLVITALVAVCAEFLVPAIEDVVEQWHISETFVGLILLPIVGNGKYNRYHILLEQYKLINTSSLAAEHVTAVTVAMKNKVSMNDYKKFKYAHASAHRWILHWAWLLEAVCKSLYWWHHSWSLLAGECKSRWACFSMSLRQQWCSFQLSWSIIWWW